jgi:hypothetical protein
VGGDGPLAPCSETFRRAARRLSDLAVETYGEDARVPLAAVRVDHAASVLKYSLTYDHTLELLHSLEEVTAELSRELDSSPAARAWWADRELRALTAAMFDFGGTAPDQEWISLPHRIDALPAVAGVRREFEADLERAGCQREDLARQDGARLAHACDKLGSELEYRVREFWMASRCDGDEGADLSPAEIYSRAWTDLLAPARVTAAAVERARLRALETARQFRLTEVAEFLEGGQRVWQYALGYLIAPAPLYWRLESPARMEDFLAGQISRWYNRPFRHRLRPLELLPPVLRAGRPLLYERPVAHALVQYQLVQEHLTPSKVYFEMLGVLERNFAVFFEAYLLRLAWLPRLKTAEAWADYFAALLDLHSGRNPTPEVWRTGFAAERGIRSPHQVLFGSGAGVTVQ